MDNNQIINIAKEISKDVLKKMAHTDATSRTPYIHNLAETWGDVTGIIGMGGEGVSGNLIISFTKEALISAVSKMFSEDFTELSPDVIEAVGEITNIIAGGIKREASRIGISIGMATPMLIVGKGIRLRQFSGEPMTLIPFSTPSGDFVVEINLHIKSNNF